MPLDLYGRFHIRGYAPGNRVSVTLSARNGSVLELGAARSGPMATDVFSLEVATVADLALALNARSLRFHSVTQDSVDFLE